MPRKWTPQRKWSDAARDKFLERRAERKRLTRLGLTAFSIQEVAELLGKGESTVWRLIKTKELIPCRTFIGCPKRKRTFITGAEVHRYQRRQQRDYAVRRASRKSKALAEKWFEQLLLEYSWANRPPSHLPTDMRRVSFQTGQPESDWSY